MTTGIGVDTELGSYLSTDDVTEGAALGSNIILVGASGAGKTTTGWLLARLIGHGFIDLDQAIEARTRMSVQQIFDRDGEGAFRQQEADLVASLRGLRSHVVSVGGGTLANDDNWEALSAMGTTIWIATPPTQIARRLLNQPEELKKRPLLADVMQQTDPEDRLKLLAERIGALIGNRVDRYKLARLTVADSFSTPESTAHLIKEMLLREKLLTLPNDQHPLDRWGIL